MKLAFLIVAAAINPLLGGDLVQTHQADQSGRLIIPSAASTNQSGGVRLWNPGSDSNHLIWSNGPTNPPVTDFQNDKKLPAPDGNPLQVGFLPPGVYKTSPYTLLVSVPGTQCDDFHIDGRGTIGPEKMPVTQGGLKFVPFTAEK